MTSGRYWVLAGGRRFLVEPIHDRTQRSTDRVFRNGGFDGEAVKHKSEIEGGSVAEDESIITPENGFQHSVVLPTGTSPEGYIDMLVRTGKKPGEQ